MQPPAASPLPAACSARLDARWTEPAAAGLAAVLLRLAPLLGPHPVVQASLLSDIARGMRVSVAFFASSAQGNKAAESTLHRRN